MYNLETAPCFAGSPSWVRTLLLSLSLLLAAAARMVSIRVSISTGLDINLNALYFPEARAFFHVAVAGEDNTGQRRLKLFEPFLYFDAVNAGHL